MGLKGGKGRRWARRDGNGIFLCIVRARTHDFAAKKTQGKNCAMQQHEQVLPPCRCIARIEAGEYERADAIACRWGVGGGK